MPADDQVTATTREWDNRCFTTGEREQMRALAEAFFDDGQTPGIAARIAWTVDEADKLVGAAGRVSRAGLRGMLAALQVLPLALGFGPRRMTALPRDERVRYLQKLEHTLLPMVSLPLFGWKSLLSVTYFEHPDALAETTYDGTCKSGAGSLLDGTRRPSQPARRALTVVDASAQGG